MALQQHFGHSGGESEIAVYLEGWVCVEHVPVEPSAPSATAEAYGVEQVGDDLIRMVAVQQPCPQVYFPAHGPSGCFIAAAEQGLAHGFEKPGRIRRNLFAGMEAIQMGHVAVLGFCFSEVVHPFLQFSALPYLVGQQFAQWWATQPLEPYMRVAVSRPDRASSSIMVNRGSWHSARFVTSAGQ